MDNNVIKINTGTTYGNSGSNGNSANWVSINSSGSQWVVVSNSTDWRAIKQVTNNISHGVSLFKVDTTPITIAKGAQIIYVEYLGPNSSYNDNSSTTDNDELTFGLVSNPSVSYSNYINYHVYPGDTYAVTKMGGGILRQNQLMEV